MEPEPETTPEPEVTPTPETDRVELLASNANIGGSLGNVVILNHDASMEIAEGSLKLGFRADRVGVNQGLFSKDASGYGTGGHLSIWIDSANKLNVRLQHTSGSHAIKGAPSVTAGVDHQLELRFGTGGMRLIVNGALWASDTYTGGIEGSREPVVIGASAMTSQPLSASPIGQPFQGSIYSVALESSSGSTPDTEPEPTLPPAPVNKAPVVSAGPDLIVMLDAGALLRGSVTDDGI